MDDVVRVAKGLSHEQADTAGRAAYEAFCAMDPIEPRQPDWGREGYKIQAAVWQAVARAAIRAHLAGNTPSPPPL